MNFLLKIVQGPNAGAEIALVEGTTISVGRGEDCDIILTDAALDEKACDIEVTSERVMMFFPNGKQHRMEEYHIKTLGTTSFVIGPDEGTWKEIIWEKPKASTTSEESEEEIEPTETENNDEPKEEEEPAQEEKKSRGILFKIIWFIILLLIILLSLGFIFGYLFPQKASEMTGGKSDKVAEGVTLYVGKARETIKDLTTSEDEKKAALEALLPKETVEDVVKQFGLTQTTNAFGALKVIGDFKTRTERLKTTGKLYHIHPGIMLDFTDADTLRNAVNGLLTIVGGGKVKVASVEGRNLSLEGETATLQELQDILEAISRDLPKIKKTDCSKIKVGLGGGVVVTKKTDESNDGEKAKVNVEFASAEAKALSMPKVEQPKLPVVGILTAPYPCLVLQSGMRIMEGAKFGEFIVKKITSESVELSGVNGTFTWRP